MKEEEARLMWSDGISRPIPRSDRSIHVKIARTIHKAYRQKKNLDGLYEILAPGSKVGKVFQPTSVIEEQNRPELRVRNSDIANFETRNERNIKLGQYIGRR